VGGWWVGHLQKEKSIMSAKFRKYLDQVDAILNELEVNNLTNALRSIKSHVTKNKQLEQYQSEVCKLLNSDNIGNAIKRLRTITSAVTLPAEFQLHPAIWLKGGPDFTPMNYKAAKNEYRVLLPMIQAVYLDLVAILDPVTRQEALVGFRQAFETQSPSELYVTCRNYLYDTNIEVGNTQASEVEPTGSELLVCLDELTKVNYGVVKSFEEE
jgi:hypothetical protein